MTFTIFQVCPIYIPQFLITDSGQNAEEQPTTPTTRYPDVLFSAASGRNARSAVSLLFLAEELAEKAPKNPQYDS